LARTETSLYGTQHPSYDIQISGTGDLVLTDVSQTSAGIAFDESLTGRISIRNSQDNLILELTKTARPLELGLEPGLYRITLQQGNVVLRAEVTLVEGRRTLVTKDNFTVAAIEPTRRRGGDDQDEVIPAKPALYTFFFNLAYEPFNFPLVGFVNTFIGSHNIFQAGFVNTTTRNFNGFQAGFINSVGREVNGFQAGFINSVGKDFSGFQSGFVNTVAGDFRAFQAGFINSVAGNLNGFQAGFINTTARNTNGFQVSFINTTIGEINGAQIGFINTAINEMKGAQAGFINTARKGIKGTQIGFFNYAESIEGIPIGFMSIVKNGGYKAVEYSFSEFHTYNIGFKTGIDKLYTAFFAAYNQTEEFELDNLAFGVGIGSILPIGKIFYLNPEVNAYSAFTWNSSSVNFTSFVPYFGVNLGIFSIAAGPTVTWVTTYNVDSMNKALNEIPIDKEFDIKQSSLPDSNYSLYTWNINDFNRIVVGARIAARVRF